jgi:DNA-binding beta-propeller fold protein YncE
VVDLSAETSSLCLSATGANPVRPHMLSFNSSHSHAVLSFVTSGHVVIFDAATRTPLACVRTSSGADGIRQAHAATPAPDDSYILITNQNGKLLERIDADFATNTFTLNSAANIDLATCLTPSGMPCQDLVLRPDNAPIIAVVDSSSSLAFITLRGGGLFVVDPTTTPMQIIGEYDSTIVHGNGFSGAEVDGIMFVNSGGGTPAVLHKFDVYAFPLAGYSPANGPNAPMPHLLYSDDGAERDSHGMVLTKRFVWVLDRVQNVAEIFDARTGAHVNRVDLNKGGPAGLAPDLADISPSGDHIFVSLRGPNPLSGDPHASTGSIPGLGVIDVSRGGVRGVLKRVVRIHNIDAGGTERADAHGIRVRLKQMPCKRERGCGGEGRDERGHGGHR